ncbi:M1 family metallopeptidase [bacterium]|nr:M1 family metallopeptidase [bacterium]
MKKLFFKILVLCLSGVLVANNSTPNRSVDILHSLIDIKIDILSEKVTGKVTHSLSPLGSALSELELDAEDMIVRRVRIGNKDIPFFQSEEKLHMDLLKNYAWSDTLDVTINYTATPRTGLYFFKPDSLYPKRKMQAWTQGEETDNHHWVPMYDYPNERATFECILTVDNKLKAISNGELVSLQDNKDGTHTFHWRENFPMVGYLISFVVGDYVKVEDYHKDIPVAYWVYPENKNEAFRSFGKTPDMIDYFNNLTGVSYPFEKYDQIIVSEFMWGGMENITLTHNSDRTMFDSKAHPDHSSDGLVAHELAHQWFGDMITTRNWANIWLNEGFATFFSRLYLTKDRGNDEGDYIRLGEIRSFKRADKNKRRPTVDFVYDEPFELFSSHVYAKGSLILTMLRDVLGEEGFWRSIRKYTNENKLKNVETSDLKKTIEMTTGKNLDWFFKQWLYEPGFPNYDVSWNYNQRKKELSIHVKQTQDLKTTSLFKMPIKIIVDNGEKKEHVIWVDNLDSVYKIKSDKRPKMVIFNSGQRVPSNLKMQKSVADLKYQLQNASNALDRIWAAHELSKKKGRKVVEYALMEAAKRDLFWAVRSEAYSALGRLKTNIVSEDIEWVKRKEVDNRVKRSFVRILKNQKNNLEVSKFLEDIIISDTSYYAISESIRTLAIVDTAKAKPHVDKLLNTESHNDVIRKSTLSYFSQVKTTSNYMRLKELAKYGNFSWPSRPTIIYELSKYQKKRPSTFDFILSFFDDNDRFVRMAVIAQVGNYGSESNYSLLDIMVEKDPVLSINASRAKSKIENRKNSTSKRSDSKTVEFLDKKLKAIKNILND